MTFRGRTSCWRRGRQSRRELLDTLAIQTIARLLAEESRASLSVCIMSYNLIYGKHLNISLLDVDKEARTPVPWRTPPRKHKFYSIDAFQNAQFHKTLGLPSHFADHTDHGWRR